MFHIFDIDNTLLFTNELNNKAYIFALLSLGLKALVPCKRITRTVVSLWYPFLTDEDLTAIVRLKQTYVNENLHLVSINNDLYRLLQEIERNKVGLWTAADPSRIQKILDYTDITNYTFVLVIKAKRIYVVVFKSFVIYLSVKKISYAFTKMIKM